jgi:hypothetical protein
MPRLRIASASLAASAVFLLSSLASAIVARPIGCGTGAACAQGFECTEIGASGCAPSAPCPAGQMCPAPEPCVTTIEYGCVPSHCTDDAQCAPGMLCHAWAAPCAVTNCACPSDAPKCDCGPTVCDPQTVSMCTPRYDLPCKVAADCGAGFTCEEAQSCGCASSGSGSGDAAPPMQGTAGTSSAGAAPAPAGGSAAIDPLPTPDCSCQPSGELQCVPMRLMCSTAANCPAGWSCQVEVSTATAPACAPGSNCPMMPAPGPAASWCVPPYYGAQSGGDLEVPVTPTTGNGSGTGTTGTGTAGTSSTGVPNEGTPAPTTTGDGEAHESSACALGHAPASSGALALLAMLGALLGLKRRRS